MRTPVKVPHPHAHPHPPSGRGSAPTRPNSLVERDYHKIANPRRPPRDPTNQVQRHAVAAFDIDADPRSLQRSSLANSPPREPILTCLRLPNRRPPKKCDCRRKKKNCTLAARTRCCLPYRDSTQREICHTTCGHVRRLDWGRYCRGLLDVIHRKIRKSLPLICIERTKYVLSVGSHPTARQAIAARD